ncbi:hypothetical protein HYS91_03295 [Candidatus Daviesbacteria bacterium]|nr:hypothetical protein [Candidatus Daviesbacteria bacterium]
MRPECITNGRAFFAQKEERYQQEFPYIAQGQSWMAKMRHRYSPDNFPLNLTQLKLLRKAGQLVGSYLTQSLPQSTFAEFRVDFILDQSGKPWIAEIQTDDRGLPAVALARNARGLAQPELLPGVITSFLSSLKQITNKPSPRVTIVYPDQDYFYYAGFYDFARLAWPYDPSVEIEVSPSSRIKVFSNKEITIALEIEGTEKICEPDLVWDFSNSLSTLPIFFQTPIDKSLLLDIWSAPFTSLKLDLMEFVPRVTNPNRKNVRSNKDNWMLKPISGKWSKGVIFGFRTTQSQWKFAIETTPQLIAQQFIEPSEQWFYVRRKNGNFEELAFFPRVEGYYFFDNSTWRLGDILATCTENFPVHGKRDCIMIPAEIR